MSDTSGSFINSQEPITVESHTHPQPSEPPSINDHLTTLYQRLQKLNQRSLNLEQQLTESNQHSLALEQQLTQANQRMLLAEGLAAQAERQAAIARENTNIRVAAPANKVKVRKPDDFDGSRDRVDYFLRQLKGYLAQEPNLLKESQLNITLSYCVRATWRRDDNTKSKCKYTQMDQGSRTT